MRRWRRSPSPDSAACSAVSRRASSCWSGARTEPSGGRQTVVASDRLRKARREAREQLLHHVHRPVTAASAADGDGEITATGRLVFADAPGDESLDVINQALHGGVAPEE